MTRIPRLSFARRLKSSIWHFRRECKQYPPADAPYVFKTIRPNDGRKLCAKCLAIERAAK